ncbi:LysR family transcriptional regulator [Ottowia thiooxydans]|uniref:LysR family transcriptional regulator n=1 Tax=Ottowia thiooxydans TaxID=219182 RepID=UPI0004053AA7|nr:LysR family transcriptional regulator [Ottowia thiooxydans]
MDLQTLRIFTRVAEEQHFAKVARSMGISPAGVSNAIKRLEAHFGVQLFARTTRSVQLTNEGQQFFESCKQALQHIEEGELNLSKSRQTPRGRLRVRMPLGFGKNIFIPALGKFMEAYPEILVEIESSKAEKAHGNADVEIRVGKVTEPGVVARQLLMAPAVICGSPGYFAKYGKPQQLSDLAGHKRISYIEEKSGTATEWILKGANATELKMFHSSFDSRIFADNVDLLVSGACAGLGLIQIANYLVIEELASGRLETVLDEHKLPGRSISVVYQPHRFRSLKVRAFIDFLSETLTKKEKAGKG